MEDFDKNVEFDTPEENYTKDNSRLIRRKNRIKKIKQRKNKVLNANPWLSEDKIRTPYLANSGEVGAYITGGTSVKTNTRKGHSSYRAKLGAYGVANNYSVRDKTSINSINEQYEEYFSGDHEEEIN